MKIYKYLKYFMIVLIIALFGMVVIALAPKAQTIVSVKALLLRIGAAVIFILTSLIIFNKKFKLKVLPIDTIIGVFFLINLISFILTPYKVYSYSYISVLFSYFIILFSIRVFLTEKKYIDLFLACFILVSVYVGIYGILLQNGIDLFKNYDPGLINRTPSTMGNPNFFAGYMIIAIFVTIGTLFYSNKVWAKGGIGVAAAIMLYSILITRTRAAFVGLAFGIVLFLGILLYKYLTEPELKKKYPDIIKFAIPAILGFFILIVIIAPGGYWKRLFAATNLKAVSTTMFRLYTWKSTLKIIRDNPVMGAGPGNFRVEYPSRKNKRIFMFEEHHNAETIHAHNEFLEIALDVGIIGLTAYLMIFISLIIMFLRFIKQIRGPNLMFLVTGLFVAVLSSLVNNFFSVNMRYISTGITFWLVIGFLLSVIILISKETEVKRFNVFEIGFVKTGLVLISVVWVILIIPYSVNQFKSDQKLKLAVELSKHSVDVARQGRLLSSLYFYDLALGNYKEALEYDEKNVIAHYFLGNLYQDVGKTLREKSRLENEKKMINKEIREMEFRINRGNLNRIQIMKLKDQLQKIKSARARNEDMFRRLESPENCFKLALEHYNVVSSISPNYVQIHYHKGRAYLNLKRFQEAKEEFEKYLEQDPVDFGSYFVLSDLYLKLGEKDKIEPMKKHLIEEINSDLEIFPGYLPLYFTLFQLYLNEQNPEMAEQSLLRALELPDLHNKKQFGKLIGYLYRFYIDHKNQKGIERFRQRFILNSLRNH